MEIQSRDEIDELAKPSNYWKTNLGPGSYEINHLDLTNTLHNKTKQNYTARINEDKHREKSSLAYIAHPNQSNSRASFITKTRMPRSFKRMFQQFTNEQRSMEEDSAHFYLLKRNLSKGDSINDGRLDLEAKGTPEHIGPGTYDVKKDTIVKKMDDWNSRKHSYSMRNHYQNYIFPLKDDTRESFLNESVAEQLHISSQIKHKRFISQSMNESNIGKHNDSQTDYVKGKIAKLGSLYEKLKLRDIINRSRISPEYGEYRPAAMPNHQISNC